MFGVRAIAILPVCRNRTIHVKVQSNPFIFDAKSEKLITYRNRYNLIYGRNVCMTTSNCQKAKATSAVTSPREQRAGELTFGQKVKETTKDVSYLGVIVGGIAVTAIMFYTIFRELFSGHSPNSVYSEALKRCCDDARVIEMAGEPIKGYGEETRRGRRRHVAHTEYIKDGVNHMRMKFYIQGSQRKGTVHLEVRENNRGKYEYRYLFVDFEGPLRNTVIVEDNRWQQSV